MRGDKGGVIRLDFRDQILYSGGGNRVERGTPGRLQTGETFLPPLGSGKVGADWTCHAPTAAYPRGYWERTAPTYQLSPKPAAHAWTVSFNEDGGFTLIPQIVRDADQLVVVAAGGDADYLEGGKGNDALYGGAGDDVYHFNPGDGEDRVHDSLAEGDNILRFGEGIGRDDLQLVENANGLTLFYGGQGDSIFLPGADRDDAVFRTVELAECRNLPFFAFRPLLAATGRSLSADCKM